MPCLSRPSVSCIASGPRRLAGRAGLVSSAFTCARLLVWLYAKPYQLVRTIRGIKGLEVTPVVPRGHAEKKEAHPGSQDAPHSVTATPQHLEPVRCAPAHPLGFPNSNLMVVHAPA